MIDSNDVKRDESTSVLDSVASSSVTNTKPLRLWQWRLRTLFVVVAAVAIVLWGLLKWRGAHAQRDIVAALQQLEVAVYYDFQVAFFPDDYMPFSDWESPGTVLDAPPAAMWDGLPEPEWLRNGRTVRTMFSPSAAQAGPEQQEPISVGWLSTACGVDWLNNVEGVALSKETAAAAIPRLKQLPRLKWVFVQCGGSCGFALGEAGDAIGALQAALPRAKVVLCWYTIPVVG